MLVIVQARMSSKRLPGKVLMNCIDRPILKWVIDRAKNCSNDVRIVVSTSNHGSDDVIEDYCKNIGVDCFRGSLDNVADRFLKTCTSCGEDKFIRVCGDSPLIDSKIIDKAIEICKKNTFDLVTNVFPRSFPKGQSVEIISLSALKNLIKSEINELEKEHLSLGIYQRNNLFKIKNFKSSEGDFSQIQLSVDTQKDFQLVQEIIKREKSISLNDFLSWYQLVEIYNDIVL